MNTSISVYTRKRDGPRGDFWLLASGLLSIPTRIQAHRYMRTLAGWLPYTRARIQMRTAREGWRKRQSLECDDDDAGRESIYSRDTDSSAEKRGEGAS